MQALRIEVEATRLAAAAPVVAVQADLARTETALEQRTTTLLAAQVRTRELERAQAAAAATREALEGELARAQQALRERDAAQAQARADFCRTRQAGVPLLFAHFSGYSDSSLASLCLAAL